MDKYLLSAVFEVSSLLFHFSFDRPFHTPKIVGLVVLCVLLARRFGIANPGWMPILLFAWPLFSFLWVTNPMDHVQAMLAAALYLCVMCVRPSTEFLEALRGDLAVVGVLICIYLFLQHLGIDVVAWEPGSAPGSFLGNANICAHFLVLAICLGRFSENASPYALPVVRAIMIGGILACQSRGALLALSIWFLFQARNLPARYLKGIYSAVVLAIVVLSFLFLGEIRIGFEHLTHPGEWAQNYEAMPLTLGEQRALEAKLARGTEISEEEQQQLDAIPAWFKDKRMSLMLREILWGNSALMAMDAPWIGKGLGQFHVTYPQWSRSWVPDVSMGMAYRVHSAHNLVLDAISQLGILWLGLLVGFLYVSLQKSDTDLRLAFGLQLLIAMFSLNYLNPLIVTTLLLFLPRSKAGGAMIKILLYGLAAVIAFLAVMDLKDTPKPSGLIPERWAAQYYESDEFKKALGAQIKAWEQDPYGPETLCNLYLIALQVPDGESLARGALLRVCELHPNYEPAGDELAEQIKRGWISDGEQAPSEEVFLYMVRELEGVLKSSSQR